MPTSTTNLGLSKPLVNNATDQDLWGGYLNTDLDTLDAQAALSTLNKDYAAFIQSRMRLKYYAEVKSSPSSSSGVLTLDFSNGNHFSVTLTENVTSIVFANWPTGTALTGFILVLKQDGTGSRTVAFPASVKGTVPVVTATASRADIFSVMSFDNGTSMVINPIQQNISGIGI